MYFESVRKLEILNQYGAGHQPLVFVRIPAFVVLMTTAGRRSHAAICLSFFRKFPRQFRRQKKHRRVVSPYQLGFEASLSTPTCFVRFLGRFDDDLNSGKVFG